MRSSRLTSFTAGAICMLLLGSGTAVAATGGKFILGRGNTASTTSMLSNTRGTALSLAAPAGKAPLAVGLIKRAVQGLEIPLEQGLALERELQARLFASADAKEGIQAYVQKRPARFEGR